MTRRTDLNDQPNGITAGNPPVRPIHVAMIRRSLAEADHCR
ncbi:MAG: hypothetical protein R2756_05135 [Bacteroidales bacterium]